MGLFAKEYYVLIFHKLIQLKVSMGRWRFYSRLTVSSIIIALSLYFLIYPALLTLRMVIDPGFRKPVPNRFTLNMFYQTSQRYDHWAHSYLQSQYANKVSQDNVAGTEWPMFGSVFYLLTAEEIQKQLSNDHSRYAQRIRTELLRTSETAAKVIVDPNTATWVKGIWGKDYLKKENVFYRMLIIMGLGSYEKISSNTTYHSLLKEQVDSMATELEKAPYHLEDDYPGECYPNDVLWAVAAIKRADSLLGSNHDELSRKLMVVMNQNLKTKYGLPPYTAYAKKAEPLEPPRGSANSGILVFASELDPVSAQQWYRNHETWFWKDNGFCRGFREFNKTIPDSVSDVDSGPVISGFGSVACVFGIGASRVMGRLDRSVPLTQEIFACSWPTYHGLIIPSLMGKLAADSSCLGEIALLFCMTRAPLNKEIIPFKGLAPWLVWVAFLVYLIPGMVLIWLEYKSWSRWMRLLQKTDKQ